MPSNPSYSPSSSPTTAQVALGDGCFQCKSGFYCYKGKCYICPLGQYCPTGSYSYFCPPDLVAPREGSIACVGGILIFL
jgi:hypothetical protein